VLTLSIMRVSGTPSVDARRRMPRSRLAVIVHFPSIFSKSGQEFGEVQHRKRRIKSHATEGKPIGSRVVESAVCRNSARKSAFPNYSDCPAVIVSTSPVGIRKVLRCNPKFLSHSLPGAINLNQQAFFRRN
jgi:hypothetical protein